MTGHHVELSPDPTGRHRVLVDGQNIAQLVAAVHVESSAREGHAVTLDLVPDQLRLELRDAEVEPDTATWQLLKALGWASPMDQLVAQRNVDHLLDTALRLHEAANAEGLNVSAEDSAVFEQFERADLALGEVLEPWLRARGGREEQTNG